MGAGICLDVYVVDVPPFPPTYPGAHTRCFPLQSSPELPLLITATDDWEAGRHACGFVRVWMRVVGKDGEKATVICWMKHG